MNSFSSIINVLLFSASFFLSACSEEQRLRPTLDYAGTRMRTTTAETERHARKAKQFAEETQKASLEIAELRNQLHDAEHAARAQAENCEVKARNAGAKLTPVRR